MSTSLVFLSFDISLRPLVRVVLLLCRFSCFCKAEPTTDTQALQLSRFSLPTPTKTRREGKDRYREFGT